MTAFLDAEAVLIGWLSGQIDARVATDLPADLEDQLPLVQLSRVSGQHTFGTWDGTYIADAPMIDLDCYASSRVQAADLVNDVGERVLSSQNTIHDGVQITRVVENVGPSWRPDFNPRVKRFGATYVLTIRPA